MTRHHVLLAAGGLGLLAGTALVFHAFDAHSHSASDTLRPFVLTMAPVWAVAIAAARIVLRHEHAPPTMSGTRATSPPRR